MGLWACIRLAPLGNQTPITLSNIYFLDNRFHPLATSQKVCDAWRKTIRTNGQLALVRALVDARQNAGLSQQQLAAKLFRPQSFVARLESGERRIDVVEFTVLARVIGFDKNEVLSIVEAATEPDHRI